MRSWCPVISFDMMTMMSLRASTSKHHLSFLVLLCLCIVCASVLVILILICPQNSVTKRKAEEMKKEKNLFSSFFKLRYLTQARMQLDINSNSLMKPITTPCTGLVVVPSSNLSLCGQLLLVEIWLQIKTLRI